MVKEEFTHIEDGVGNMSGLAKTLYIAQLWTFIIVPKKA